MKALKILLVVLAVIVSFTVGVIVSPAVRPLILPASNPCETRPCVELSERCKRAEAAGNLKLAMGCGLFLISDEKTDSTCRELCEKMDKYGSGR